MITMLEESFIGAARAIPGFVMNAFKAHPAASTAIVGGGALASTVDGIDHEVTTPSSQPEGDQPVETNQPTNQNTTQQSQQQPQQQQAQQQQQQKPVQPSFMTKVTDSIKKNPVPYAAGAAGVIGAAGLLAARNRKPQQQSF